MIAEQLLKEGPFLLFAQSPLAGASIMELAVSVVQSSYFPSPRNFHIQQVDNLLSAVCGQAANQYTTMRLMGEVACKMYDPLD